jgi:hypothetical protein
MASRLLLTPNPGLSPGIFLKLAADVTLIKII